MKIGAIPESPRGLTREEYSALRWAVERASEWRGAYVGHPDASLVLAAFDRRVKVARRALRIVSPYQGIAKHTPTRLQGVVRDYEDSENKKRGAESGTPASDDLDDWAV